MKRSKLLSRFILFLIILLVVIPIIISDNLAAADISEKILDEYKSFLNDSRTAFEEGNYSEAKRNLEKASLLLWNNSPLQVENITLAKRPPEFYGYIVPVEDKNYQPGERLFLYLEPKNYLLELNQEGNYKMNIVLDTKLIFEDGTILFHDPEFLRYKKESSRPNRELNFHMFFNLGGKMDSGEYTIKMEVTDILSDKKIVVESKFNFTN
jgi:hypothetical protein